MTQQAALTPTPETRLANLALWHRLGNRLILVLVAVALIPAALTALGVLLLLDGLRAEWAAAPDLPAVVADRLDALPGQVILVGLVAFGLAFLLFAVLSWAMRGRSLSRRSAEFSAFSRFAQSVAGGDLAARLALPADADEAQVQLGQILNEMVSGMQSMTRQVKAATQGLTITIEEIRDATNDQIGTATRQDEMVTQTTATVNEVRATVTETAERAQSVAETAQASIEVSRSGEQAVTDAIEGMQLIRRCVEDIADNILILSEHTQQIGEIIATVNRIADQSKMLALNASVEAARAGEEGKGFAVVAAEVRSLAEQSREATAQVRDILSEIQRATNAAVMVTEEGTKGVDHGVGLVDRAGRAIRELARTIEDNATAAVQIAASTRQQAVGMDQLTSAMQMIKAATAEATSSTMQVERNVQALQSVAEELTRTLARYRL